MKKCKLCLQWVSNAKWSYGKQMCRTCASREYKANKKGNICVVCSTCKGKGFEELKVKQ